MMTWSSLFEKIVFMTRSEPSVVLVDFDECKGYGNSQKVKKDQYRKDLMNVSNWTEKDLEDYLRLRSEFDNRTYE